MARDPAADAAQRRLAQPAADRRGARPPRICGFESFRTAASRGCASTATSSPTGSGCDAAGDVDLAAAEHGGLVVACSDMFFGSRHNLIMPGDATHMGDGWETRRRRGPGHDWTIIRLGAAGTIRRIEVDTRHFKGNAPGACSLEAPVEPAQDCDRGMARPAAAHAAPAARAALVRERIARRSATSRTCGSTSFRTAASAGCGCSAGRGPDAVRHEAGRSRPANRMQLDDLERAGRRFGGARAAPLLRLDALGAYDGRRAARFRLPTRWPRQPTWFGRPWRPRTGSRRLLRIRGSGPGLVGR